MLRRPQAYLAAFIYLGQPDRLDEEDRGRLARFFGVDEWELGGPGDRR